MTTFLDVRGTHGSGKSWLIHQILSANDSVEIRNDEGKLEGYSLSKVDCFVIGKYSNQCGGCDGINKADEIVRRIRHYGRLYSLVLFEGILVSHTFQRYHELAKELEEEGHSYKFCFLNTPKKACIARVRKRRKEQGNLKEFDPKNLIKDWHQIWERVRQRMVDAGHTVIVLEWRDPLTALIKEMGL